MQGALSRSADFLDHLHNFGIILIEDDIRPGFDDPGLRAGDLRQRVPEIFRVLKAYMCDHGHFRRINDVGGIELAAQSHLQYYNVTFLPAEIDHSDRRDELELARMVLHVVRFRSYEAGDLTERLF